MPSNFKTHHSVVPYIIISKNNLSSNEIYLYNILCEAISFGYCSAALFPREPELSKFYIVDLYQMYSATILFHRKSKRIINYNNYTFIYVFAPLSWFKIKIILEDFMVR